MGSLWLSWTMLAALTTQPVPPAVLDGRPAALVLRFSDPEETDALPVEAVRAEAQRLFAPLGVQLLREDEADGQAVVQVVLLAQDRSRGGLRAHAMGAVSRDPADPPAVWIILPSLRRALDAETWPSVPPALMARAAGRVLAHELVHLIAPDLPHATSGLMRASLGKGHLLNERAALEAGLGPLLRHRLARGRLRRMPAA